MKDCRRNVGQSVYNRSKGFTLVELIVVLVIIAILAALAVPALLGFIDDAHKKQVISRAQTALASTQASLSDIYTLNDNEFTVEKRDQTRINAGESNDTAFTVWSERPLYDERDGEREATVAVTEELGSYTVAQAIFDAGDSNFAAYDGEKWEVYDSLEAAKTALGIADDDKRVIYVWPYDDYSDTARQPEVDPTPDPDDPLPDPPVVLATKTVHLRNEKKDRAFFADDAAAEAASADIPGITVTFSKIDEDNYETDWQWNEGGRTFSLNGQNRFLNLLKTYAFRYWTEDVTGYICRNRDDIADYIFNEAREAQIEFTFFANVLRDDIDEQAVVSNPRLHELVKSHDTDNVVQAATEDYELNTLPGSKKRIDDETHPGFYIYAWYDGNTLKWWTNALVAFMPRDCSGMLSSTGRLHYFSFEGFDVSKIEIADDLFAGSTGLHTIDFGSDFIAPKLKQMNRCFKDTDAISGTFDLSGIIEIGPQVYLEAAFMGMDRVTGFDFGNGIKNSEIMQLRQTFSTCKQLTSIDLSGFKASKATSCYEMLYSCSALTEIKLGGDLVLTSNTSLKRTFAKCGKLEKIDGRIVTGTALNDMRECFDTDSSLIQLDVSGIDPTNVASFRSAFKEVNKLETLDLTAWIGKPKKVVDLRQTFFHMYEVRELNLSQWNLNDLNVMYSTFNGCKKAQIIVDGWGDPNLCPKGNKLFSVAYAFNDCSSMTGIVDLSNWETLGLAGRRDDEIDPDTGKPWGETYDLRNLFNGCSNLEGVRLQKWNFTNVQNFDNVFLNCSKLELLDLTGAKAIRQDAEGSIKGLCRPNNNNNKSVLKKVILKDAQFDNFTTVAEMYSGYSALEYIDLRGFKANGATSAYRMFYNCSELTTVLMNGLEMPQVENASAMFMNCTSLEEFTESGFNMGSVRNMSSFFDGCTSLKRFNLSSLPVANVTNMDRMFRNCKAFKKLNLSALPVKSATTMKNMFEGCSAMEELDISEWELLALNDTANISNIFNGCSSLKKLSMKKWRNKFSIFKAFLTSYSIYRILEELDLSDCDLQERQSMKDLFLNCYKIQKLELKGFKTGGITDMSFMFKNCHNLKAVDISSFDMNNVTTTQEMFAYCYSLESVNLGTNGLQFNNIKTMKDMFRDCISLRSADFSQIRTGNQLESTEQMFRGCFRMPKISIEGFDLSNVTIMTGMFNMVDWVEGKSGTVNGFTYSVTKEQFEQDSALTEIVFGPKCVSNKISGSDNIGSLFKQCINLKTIKVYPGTDFSVIQPGKKKDIFLGDAQIVGGNGTSYKGPNHEYARIDGVDGKQGYFTDINAAH